MKRTYNANEADFVVILDPGLDGSAWGNFNRQGGYLQIASDTLSESQAFLQSILFHEFGHSLYFEQVGSSCCGISIMATCGPGNFTTWLTPSDYSWIDIIYPPPPEWCNPTECSPIVMDLGARNIRLTGPLVWFDFQGTGSVQFVAWTDPTAGDGFLVLDRDGDGIIRDGREMFGNFTPLSATLRGISAPNGFEALRWFDDPAHGGDDDGKIGAADRIYSRLRVWVDVNANGASEPSELRSLAALGVDSISLAYRVIGRRDRFGNRLRYASQFTITTLSGAERRSAIDVLFQTQGR